MSKAQTVAEIAGPRLAENRKFEQVRINTIHYKFIVYSNRVQLIYVRKYKLNETLLNM